MGSIFFTGSFTGICSVVFVQSCWQTNEPTNRQGWKHNPAWQRLVWHQRIQYGGDLQKLSWNNFILTRRMKDLGEFYFLSLEHEWNVYTDMLVKLILVVEKDGCLDLKMVWLYFSVYKGKCCSCKNISCLVCLFVDVLVQRGISLSKGIQTLVIVKLC